MANILQPLVSIIMPVYNAENYIKRALDSVIGQSYKKIEIVIIDDGSTDKSAEIIKSYKDMRIRYIYQDNSQIGAARNHGLRECNGDYITFLDADDQYFGEKIEKQINFFIEHPSYQVVYSKALYFYTNRPDTLYMRQREYPSGHIFAKQLKGHFININTLMFHRSVFEEVKYFNENKFYPEDWEYCLRISLAGFEIGFIDKFLVKIETRENSNTTMEIQFILKQNALSMITSSINESYSLNTITPFMRNDILESMEFKVLIAFLVSGKKEEFLKRWKVLYKGKLLSMILGNVLAIVPANFIRWTWRLNQKRNMKYFKD